MSKIVRFTRFVWGLVKPKDHPLAVNYEITRKCNSRCQHCYHRGKPSPEAELSDEEWKNTFQQHNARGVKSAYLTGGEPTLRMGVIRSADKIFRGLGMVSNGIIKVPEDIQRRIFISLDGPKEVHNRIRGVDAFDNVIKNIQGDRRVIITPTLSTTNYQHIEELVRIARESGVGGITFSTYTSHQQEDDPLLLGGEKLDETVRRLDEVRRKNKDLVFLTSSMINLFRTKKHAERCYFKGSNFVSYDPGMNVKRPCVIGEGVNCNTCGCIVPVMSYALSHFDVGAWFILERIFPEKYRKQLHLPKTASA